MFGNLRRRKRNLVITSALGLLFISILIMVFWVLSPKKQTYLPGEEIEGLTANLDRSIPQDYPRVTFIDVSKEAGIKFQHFYGQRSTQLPEDMGSGAAWGDYDNDGWLDLFVANEVGPLSIREAQIRSSPAHCRLYHNQGDGTFKEVSVQAGVDLRAWAIAPTWGDYDNDGALDLFVSCYGKNRLYHNNGDGTFSDESTKAGVNELDGFWAGNSWGDINRDGFIDLYVCGYVQYFIQENQASSQQYDVEVPASINPSSFKPERNLLFLNNQDGTFSEIAKKARVDDTNGRSLSATWCDFDEDGWPDIYVANDVSDNVLYRNNGDNTFKEISHSALVADYRGAMGIAVGDWDGDSDMDIFITHWIAQENALYNNMRSHFLSLNNPINTEIKFMDEADRYGLGQIGLDYIGWGTSFFDYDNDGKLDLFVVNGSTFQQKQNPLLLIPMVDQLFWNQGKEKGFYDVSAVSGEIFKEQYVGRGAAFGDYDNDGDVDIFIVNNGGPGILLRNEGGNKNKWLKLDLHGVQSNSAAIGTKIRIVAGESTQIQQVGVQCSYCSQNSLIQHFGLGESVKVDTLEINWPSGTTQVFHNLPVNQSVEIIEGKQWSRSAETKLNTSNIPEKSDKKEKIRNFWEHYWQATKHRIAGNLELAIAEYKNALEINGQHEDALHHLGNMYLEMGEYQAAERTWLRLLEKNPNSGRAHIQLGNLYLNYPRKEFFDIEKATAEFRVAFEINKEETAPILYLGQIFLIKGALENAQSYFSDVVGSNYKSVEAHFLNGYIFWKRGELELALNSLNKAVEYAKPEKKVNGVSAEGDTKEVVYFTRSVNQSIFYNHLNDLWLVNEKDFSRELETRYGVLDAFILKVRSI